MTILALNGGSSSIKYATFEGGSPPVLRLAGALDHVSDFDGAITALFAKLESDGTFNEIAAVGHRIVYGGPNHFDPEIVTPPLLADLRNAIPFAPNHLPAELRLIEAVAKRLPQVPQVVCFDTAFHKDLPRVAAQLPIPRRYFEAGVRRYGFHGLSFAYLLQELARRAGAEAANGKVILAHLGSGSSLAAVRGSRCVDTTMGFTPAGGLMMGTRTGDLDPGVLLYLLRNEELTADGLDRLVNRESGMLGLSETTADMREIVTRRGDDPRAADAFDSYCHSAIKMIGAMAASLGGVETLVFSGGIGEHSAEVRERIRDGLAFLGNLAVHVIPTDEESMIATYITRLLERPQP